MPTLTTYLTLTQLLIELVEQPTVTSDTHVSAATLDWIAGRLRRLPLTVHRLNNQGIPALVATTPAADPKNPRLWLAGHIDVVPAASGAFQARIDGGRLYGRGAYDMKYAVACFLRLLEELGPELAQYDLGFLLTADEETGGTQGARWLVEEHGYRGQAVLLPECGNSWTIETAAKGTMSWQLRARGVSSHASRPWNGTNAIDQLTAFVAHLKTNVPAEPCGDEDHIHDTISLGHLSGGSVANQIPGVAGGLLDIRLAPGTSLADVKLWFDTAARTVPGVDAHMIHGSGPTANLLEGPAAVFAGMARDVAGVTLTPTVSHGASDGRYFSVYNIPVISVPPTGGGQHSDTEWIDLASLEQYYEIVRRFTQVWAGPGRRPHSSR
ncbi:MAG: M20/M25/M40 family metallo-hydrolase [Candidatus Saccharimonadales bacterium]